MKPSKKYSCIAKVGDQAFVKYRLNDLVKFTTFLDVKYPDWRYFNVYDKGTREQIGNFTKTNRPQKPSI